MPKRRKNPLPSTALAFDENGQPLTHERGAELLRKRLLPITVREAMVTGLEIRGEADPGERRKNELARDRARAELMRMYRKARDGGRLHELDRLDPRVRRFCEDLIAHDPAAAAKANKRRIGAPARTGDRMEIAVAVELEIEALGGGRGAIAKALGHVAQRYRIAERYRPTREAVRKIHEDRDPEWRLALRAGVAIRKMGDLVRVDPAAAETLSLRFEDNMRLDGGCGGSCFESHSGAAHDPT
jgi:hypothetical protein